MQRDWNNVKRSELGLREPLSALEQDWLRGCSVSNVGVTGAIYSDQDPYELVVEYASDPVNGRNLLDILYLRGVRAELRNADVTPTGAANVGAADERL